MAEKETDQEFENFIHNIIWLRKQHGLSKKEMAKILGIGMKSMEKIEKGEIPPRLGINAMVNILNAFGVALQDQMGQRLGD